MQFPKKITTKTCGLTTQGCESIAFDKGQKAAVSVLRIVGRISKIENGQSQFGPWVKFHGEHMAINCETSEEYRSSVCILPEIAAAPLLKFYEQGKAKDPNAMLQFGLDITVAYYKPANEKSTKFTWGVVPMFKIASEEDALSLMAKQFGAVPLLNPPAVEEKKSAKK